MPVDRATKTLPGGPPPGLPPWVKAIASDLWSWFTSPMAQASPARHIPLDHSAAGRKEWPVDRATKALPGGPPPGLPPWVNVIASALPSPLTSPMAQVSPARQKWFDHSTAGRKEWPVDRATNTVPGGPPPG